MKLRHKHKEGVVEKELQMNLNSKAANDFASFFRGGEMCLKPGWHVPSSKQKMK